MRNLLLTLILFFGIHFTYAQHNWDGDNAVGRFDGVGYCNNWFADACQPTWNSTTDLLFNIKNSGLQTTMYFNYGMWQDVNNIVYMNTFNAAMPLDCDGNGMNFYGKIENNSTFAQTLNTPFHGKHASVIELNPISGDMIFNNPIYNASYRPFQVWGNLGKKLTLNSFPEGNNTVSLSIKQNSIVEVNYNNALSLSGGYFVENGELWVNSNGVIQGNIQVGNGNANTTKLYISHLSTATTVANPITVAASSTNASIGSLNTINTHTYSGTINLNNNTVNFDVVNAAGTADFTGVISGAGAVQKINPGLVRLSAANTYTGNTIINTGTLQYGIANAISNSSNVILSGGTLSTGATTGYSDTVGTLALTANSTIALGTGTHALTFANSNAVVWTMGTVLTITGWTNSCNGAKVFVGNNNTGLTAAQLSQVQFPGYPSGAKISPVGELIPNNLMLTATGGTATSSYATLTAAFAAINAGTHTGAVTITILNDIDEGANTIPLTGAGGYATLLIQPGGCGPRTITGTGTGSAGNALIFFNGADNVTVDGLNTGGNSLTISNTSTSATSGTCTLLFQNDATSNTITNCDVLGSATMAAGTAGGNIWFGAGAITTGNSFNTVSNCNLGPAGTNLPTKAICFTGTTDASPFNLYNDNITITNNNIFDYFSPTASSSGIDLISNTITSSFTNNRFYQTAPRTQSSASLHSGIRINFSTNGTGYTVTGNTVGYGSSTGTGTYTFTGIQGSNFIPFSVVAATATPSLVQNNTVAGITYNTSAGVSFNTLFTAFSVTGSNVIANTIGLPSIGGGLTFHTTAGIGGGIFGINSVGSGSIAIQNNVIQSITTTTATTPTPIPNAAFDLTGIFASGGNYTITNNTIGHTNVANSISMGTLGTSSTQSNFRGVSTGTAATGSMTIGNTAGTGNTIQNITFNATGNNTCYAIYNTGVNLGHNVNFNTIKGVRFAASAGSVFIGIGNTAAINGVINITNNTIGIVGSEAATYTIASTGTYRGIYSTNGGASANLSITSNTIRGAAHTVTGTSAHTYIFNSGNCPSGHNIGSNTLTGIGTTGGAVNGIDDTSTSVNKTISGNTINALASTGAAVTGISSSNGTTVAIGSNSISNLSSTATGATATVCAITATGGTTVSVTSNPISNLSSANDGVFTGILMNAPAATTVSVTSNTINGMTSTTTGANSYARGIEVLGICNANISTNTISNISSPLTGNVGGVVGISNASSGTASTISSNTIFGINATSTANAVVGVTAIVTGNTGAGGTISKNKIYGLTNTTTHASGNSTIGMAPNGGNWTIANNMVSITNNNTVQAVGVYDTGASGARNYFYNSIYIGGTHAGVHVSHAFQFNSVTGTANVKNNIFVMQRTSGAKNYAIANTAGSFSGLTADYNVYNCSVASTIGLSGSTDRTFTAWKSASAGDTNSFSGIPVAFTNTATADLHLITTCSDTESGGTPVAVTDDYDGAVRHATTPDIGADEYTGTKPADITLTPNTPICTGTSTTLTVTSTDPTYTYTWSPATGLSATTGASVTANPTVATTYTVLATSPSSCTKSKDVTISVNPLPAPISVSPNSVNICANTVQMFTASPNTGTVTVGTDTGTSLSATTPYQQSILVTSEARAQYLITRAELNAAGLAGGNITSLAFFVKTVGVSTMPSYIISMANTTDTALTATYIATGFTTVYSGTNILPVAGLNTHTFSTPFAWDGTSNIVINICHTSSGGGTLSGVAVTTFASAMTNKRSGMAACSAAASIVGTSPIRPVMTLGYENPITWSPTTNLYTNLAATTAYNPAVHLNQPTIYAKPSGPVVYTATLTTVGTGCTQTATATITNSASVWNGSGWLPSTPTGNTSLQFTGSYTSSSNLTGCSCTVNAGAVVTFNDPATLTLTNGVTVDPGATLTFNNNASLLQTNDAATNSGTVNIQRITQPMYRFDYTYWGTPVTQASNFTLGLVPDGLSPDTLSDKFYSWTPTVSNAGGIWAQESAATVMNPIMGYIVRAPATFSFNPAIKTNYTATFKGVPNNGVVSSPIYHGTLAASVNDDKYNLLGNPYPSALDAQAFLTNALNTPIIDGTIYFWTHNSPILAGAPNPFYGTYALNYNNNDYAAWNSLGAVGFRGIIAGTGGVTPNGYIGVGQGFFTKSTGTAATGATVTFNNSMRVAGNNNQFFRSANTIQAAPRTGNIAADKHRIWLDLISSGGGFSQILVGYLDDATLGWDRMYDGVPMDESGMLLYSVIPDRKLVIQGRPMPFDEQDQVQLGFKSTAQDTYSFGLDAVDGLFENQNIYIEDKAMGIIHNLKTSPYSFTAGVGTFSDRFVLRYNNTTLGNPEFDAEQHVIATVHNHQLLIQSSKSISAIQLYDVSGKLIKTLEPKENSRKFTADFTFESGVYFAKIKLENGIEVTKKIIH